MVAVVMVMVVVVVVVAVRCVAGTSSTVRAFRWEYRFYEHCEAGARVICTSRQCSRMKCSPKFLDGEIKVGWIHQGLRLGVGGRVWPYIVRVWG